MTEQPNIIWIFGDQHRGQALGSAGDPNARTPHLDRLAASGVSFSRAYCNYPLCCPARGTLLTSRHAHDCVPVHESRLPAGMPTLAAPLRAAGLSHGLLWKVAPRRLQGSQRAGRRTLRSARAAGRV